MSELINQLMSEKKAPKKTAAFSLNADTLAKLKEIAEKTGVSVSAVANAILTKALSEE